MSNTLNLHILRDLIPAGLDYGANLLVEFQPDSIWYETSLAIAADAIKQGIKTEYHYFQHTPEEIRRSLANLGVDAQRTERNHSLTIIDDYTVQTGLADTSRSLKIADWSIEIAQKMKSSAADDEVGRNWLHVDDNASILTRYNPENVVVDWFRTRAIPVTKTLQRIAISGLLTGVASDAFYNNVESLYDGIIDFKTEEKDGKIAQFLRVRIMRGKSFDSHWHRLGQLDDGQVTLTT